MYSRVSPRAHPRPPSSGPDEMSSAFEESGLSSHLLRYFCKTSCDIDTVCIIHIIRYVVGSPEANVFFRRALLPRRRSVFPSASGDFKNAVAVVYKYDARSGRIRHNSSLIQLIAGRHENIRKSDELPESTSCLNLW